MQEAEEAKKAAELKVKLAADKAQAEVLKKKIAAAEAARVKAKDAAKKAEIAKHIFETSPILLSSANFPVYTLTAYKITRKRNETGGSNS